MSHPIIRIYLGDSNRKPECECIYFGPHPTIPRIGEHLCVQFDCHKVWRVEHILNPDKGHPCAHIHISKERS